MAMILGPATAAQAESIAVWANQGEDKVAQEETRLLDASEDVRNSVWDGETIRVRAAVNETVAFNLIIEAAAAGLQEVTVGLGPLTGDSGTIDSRPADSKTSLFDYRGRNVECFLVRYLKIQGCSKLAYEHYDERHVPHRLRRPHDADGFARGGWMDRPDHDRSYPDIAVPMELHPRFDIAAHQSQSVWFDVYVSPDHAPGVYRGKVRVTAAGQLNRQVPVELEVIDIRLPDLPSAKTMLVISNEDINQRYVGRPYIDDAPVDVIRRSKAIVDRHFQMAHRHRISLVHEHTPIEMMDAVWKSRLDGSLFTAAQGYEGPGQAVGNNIFAIGTYGAWPWKNAPDPKSAMWRNTDAWAQYLPDRSFATPTETFLYLADESDDDPQVQQWADWVKENPGPGANLPTMATMPLPRAVSQTPSLSLPCSTLAVGITEQWQAAAEHIRTAPGKRFWMYNGFRPASGTMATDDDGVAMRQLAWCQFKFQVDRWFLWSGTYYRDFQGSGQHTRLFSSAKTFGGEATMDPVLGQTGWNYNNGDGVLFYPGTDQVYPDESYDIDGPIASLRMKHWRRGLQDYEYLQMAGQADAAATMRVVQSMIPRALWEVSIDEPADPTYARTDISWSTDPDVWESARDQLIRIILDGRD
ncbi:DUF4091 domain-containing protein [Rubripirellula lacrimiformis]|nr:DUF4091 domain-containing protein [Rubripirellula lacrimiformis]